MHTSWSVEAYALSDHKEKREGDKIIGISKPPSSPVPWQEVGINLCCSYTSLKSTKAGVIQGSIGRRYTCMKVTRTESHCWDLQFSADSKSERGCQIGHENRKGEEVLHVSTGRAGTVYHAGQSPVLPHPGSQPQSLPSPFCPGHLRLSHAQCPRLLSYFLFVTFFIFYYEIFPKVV